MMRARLSKCGNAKYVSHLDFVRILERALRMSGIRMRFSRGFNPRPRIFPANPLPLGYSSLAEYVDFGLVDPVAPGSFASSLNRALPLGIKVLSAKEVESGKVSLMAQVAASEYLFRISVDGCPLEKERVAGALAELLDRSKIPFEKAARSGRKVVDIRPLLLDIKLLDRRGKGYILDGTFRAGQAGNLRPEELMLSAVALGLMPQGTETVWVLRRELFLEQDGRLISPL